MSTPSIHFYRSGPRNSCRHGQRQITKWWHLDCKLINMHGRPIDDVMDNMIFFREVAGRRLWVYSWFITFHIDFLLTSKLQIVYKHLP